MDAVERAYKRFAIILIVCFLMLSVIIALLSDGGRLCAGSADAEPVMLTYSRLEDMDFLEEAYYISVGDQMALRLRTEPEIYEDVITWSSSDARVLRVDGSGIVTACGNGTAVITAACGSVTSSVTISVVDDILVEASECVRALSEGCGEESLRNALDMAERLERCTVEGAKEVRGLILNIIAYAEGGDRTALEKAIGASGLDRTLCRTAAVCCWAYGEQRNSDGVLSFVGDCTLGRYNESAGQGRFPSVYDASGSLTYPFDRVKGVFACDDLTMVNFEGTLTDSTAHREKTFYFRGEPRYAGMLPASSVEAANLANNHSYDYYRTGFDDTRRHLNEAGVKTVSQDAPLTVQVGKSGLQVVFLAATSGGEEYTDLMHRTLLEWIRQYKNSETVVVVNLHWGVEGSSDPEEWQREAAHELIDAGADLIIGHHPHVLQGIEMYNGKYIAYSLGNFAFGGNGSSNAPQSCILRARTGVIDGAATITGVSVLPCRTTSTGTTKNNYQPMLCFGADGDSVYSTLISRSEELGGVEKIDRPDV